MKTMKWLMLRELWEHKGMFLWAPVVVALLMIGFGGISVFFGNNDFPGTASMPPQEQAEFAHTLANSFMVSSLPLFVMLGVIAFFYCVGSMYDERRDRSILFWKSLPVSDSMTVISKVLAALCMVPLIYIVAAGVVSFVLLLFAMIVFRMTSLFGPLFSEPAFYLAPLQLIGVLPVYILWALPTVGWLMMVSSWAKSKVFLWAVGLPLLIVGLVKWADFLFSTGWDIKWFFQHVISRGLFGLFPGNWMFFEHGTAEEVVASSHMAHGTDLTTLFTQGWQTLADPSVWIGAVVGVAMIVAAIRLRRWRDDG